MEPLCQDVELMMQACWVAPEQLGVGSFQRSRSARCQRPSLGVEANQPAPEFGVAELGVLV